jgi:hypothetical protein
MKQREGMQKERIQKRKMGYMKLILKVGKNCEVYGKRQQ